MTLAKSAALFQDMVNNPGYTEAEYASDFMDIIDIYVKTATITQSTLVATDSVAGPVTLVSGSSTIS